MNHGSGSNFRRDYYFGTDWTVSEALYQAAAALPDVVFAQKYGIPRKTIDVIQDVLSETERGQDRHALTALIAARRELPKAWPEPPNDLFAALDRAIINGHLNVLSQYPEKARVGDLYDDEPPFADALVALIPRFEYPDHSHRTVGESKDIAQQHCNQAFIDHLVAEGVKLVSSGRFIGKVVGVVHDVVVQDVGRGVLVAHKLPKEAVQLARGQMVDLRYERDGGIVVNNLERGGLERG